MILASLALKTAPSITPAADAMFEVVPHLHRSCAIDVSTGYGCKQVSKLPPYHVVQRSVFGELVSEYIGGLACTQHVCLDEENGKYTLIGPALEPRLKRGLKSVVVRHVNGVRGVLLMRLISGELLATCHYPDRTPLPIIKQLCR